MFVNTGTVTYQLFKKTPTSLKQRNAFVKALVACRQKCVLSVVAAILEAVLIF